VTFSQHHRENLYKQRTTYTKGLMGLMVLLLTAGAAALLGILAVLLPLLFRRWRKNHDQRSASHFQNSPRFFSERAQEASGEEAAPEDQEDPVDTLRVSITLADRVALARFVVTMCGVGPHADSLQHMDDAYPPRMNYLRKQVNGQLRKLTGLSDLPAADAERVFEELAHSQDFFKQCIECAVLLHHLLTDRYRPIAEKYQGESKVIHPELLPSEEALEQLISW
jgi:hypothetical protein